MSINRCHVLSGVVAIALSTSAAQAQQLKHFKHKSSLQSTPSLKVPGQFNTIQAAIDAAGHGDTVVVADGVYTGPGNVDLDFGGKVITVRSAHGAAQCVIDCQGTQEDPHRGFNFHSGEGRGSVVDGFTITNGSTPQGAIDDHFNGAGILCTDGSSPTIQNCVLTNNWAGCWGAAISCSFESHPLIKGCAITNNYADDDGGAVFAWAGSSPVIMNTLIADNGALITGGGVTNFSSTTMTIINSTIVNNDAQFISGVFGNNVTIINSIVHGNFGDDEQLSVAADVTFSAIEGGYFGQGNLDTDPMFIDAENGNYHLSIGSPLINAGMTDVEFLGQAVDMDGDPRVSNGAIDIGADEVVIEDTSLDLEPSLDR